MQVLDVAPQRGIGLETLNTELEYPFLAIWRSDEERILQHLGIVDRLQRFALLYGLPLRVIVNYFRGDSDETFSLKFNRTRNWRVFRSHSYPRALRVDNSLSVEQSGAGGLLGGLRLQVKDDNSSQRNEYTDDRKGQVSSIKAILAGIVGILLLGLSLWLMYGSGQRSLIRLGIFYLCFALTAYCLLVVDRYACQKLR